LAGAIRAPPARQLAGKLCAVEIPDPRERAIANAVLVLSLAAFGSGLSQRIVDPLLPRLADEFVIPLGAASWAITSFTVGYAFCQLLFGPIGDRYGKYLVIAWGCAASAVASLACALAATLPQLLVARAFAGGMTAAIIPLAMAWIGDVIPYERRQPVLARFLIGTILGASAGQLLGGLSADHFGRHVPFAVIALLFAASATLMFGTRRFLPEQAQGGEPIAGHALQRMWREFARVLGERHARVVLRTVFLEGAAVFGAFAFFAAHVHRELDVSLTAAGLIVMLFGFGGFVFAVRSRQLVGRLGEAGLVRWGVSLMCASLCAIAFVPVVALVAPACLAMGTGFYMFHNTLQTHATQMAPERRGAAVAAFALCFFLGQSVGVATAGALVGRLGTRAVLLLAATGIALLGASFIRELRR
jgi:predicted MFS family arabinose efflux permease